VKGLRARMTSELHNGWKLLARNTCQACAIRDGALCAALSKDELASLNKLAWHRRFRNGQRIISEQERPDRLGIIVTGSIKLTKVLPDGRQQIVALLFPSDFVGQPFEAPCSYRAEAVTDVTLCTFPAAQFEELMQRHPRIESRLFRHMLNQLEAAQDWMVLLGRKTAQEKVASLFAMIARRTLDLGCTDRDRKNRFELQLPLSRTEIAEFLGLTIETVSRQLRILKSDGIIQFSGRRNLTVLDMSKLEAAAASMISQDA